MGSSTGRAALRTPWLLPNPLPSRIPISTQRKAATPSREHRRHARLPQAEQGRAGERGAGERHDSGASQAPRDDHDDGHDHRREMSTNTASSPCRLGDHDCTCPEWTASPIIDNARQRVGDFLRAEMAGGSVLSFVSACFIVYARPLLMRGRRRSSRSRPGSPPHRTSAAVTAGISGTARARSGASPPPSAPPSP